MTAPRALPSARPGGEADAVDGVVPRWVVQAADVAAVQDVVRAELPLVATGLGAHLDRGAPPAQLEVVVRLDRLDRVLDHQAADMTVTVEAGCSFAALQTQLAEAGQWLPLDPPRPDVTTLGGVLAANLSGPLRTSQGTARDLLLGLKVVGADGALIAGGGRVVKNVAGYDLPKLHVGALGTAGVIVEATFKVRPRPEHEAAVVIACSNPLTAGDVALAVRAALDPFWIEIGGPGVLPATAAGDWSVAVGLAGIEAEVVHAGALAQRVAVDHGCDAVVVADGAALRAELGAFDVAPAAALLRAATLPTGVGAVLDAAVRATLERGAPLRCAAHAASGVVRIAVDAAEHVAPLVQALRPRLLSKGGTLVVQRARPEVKRGLDVWGDVGPGLPLMRRLKAAVDPAGVFAPGRYVGGL